MRSLFNAPALFFCLCAISSYATLAVPQEDTEGGDPLRHLQTMRIDTTRFAVGVEMSRAPTSTGLRILSRVVDAEIQLYIVDTWSFSYSTQPVVSTPKNYYGARQLDDQSEAEFHEEDVSDRSLQSFKCKFSYCSVIGCNNCPKHRRNRELQACFPRIPVLEGSIRDSINNLCTPSVCGGTVNQVFAIEVPAGSPLVELSSVEICP
jgi:hypothetical protein